MLPLNLDIIVTLTIHSNIKTSIITYLFSFDNDGY